MAKTSFPTQFTERKEIFISNPGSRIKETFTGKYNEKGELELVKTGTKDIYAEIQADTLSCDINYIIAAYTAGDKEALNQVQGVYMDATNMPTNLRDAYNAIKTAEKSFDSLPVEIKQKFGNNAVKYMTMAGTPEFNEIFENYIEEKNGIPKTPEPKQEVGEKNE